MNSKRRKTLKAIFDGSVAVDWSDVVKLLAALGCENTEGEGSRVRFTRGTDILRMHKPHKKDVGPGRLTQIRKFLIQIGAEPDDQGDGI